jgi:kinesin family member C1
MRFDAKETEKIVVKSGVVDLTGGFDSSSVAGLEIADQAFTFDRVFPPSCGQDDIFEEVQEFVQSALDGFRVCLFSYGQTGSGKTFTMQGYGREVQRGIIPRAVEQVLSQSQVLEGQNWSYRMYASFMEIYNEQLRDLLAGMEGAHVSYAPDQGSTKQAGLPGGKLDIKRNASGQSFVSNLTRVEIDVKDRAVGNRQLDELMNIAEGARSVASTSMNETSSRSHSVFQLHLEGSNSELGTELQGVLNLCDLAGSERLARSNADKDATRLKETQVCTGAILASSALRLPCSTRPQPTYNVS